MSLVQRARLNGLSPCAYLKDVLQRLPTQPTRRRSCCHIGGPSLATTAHSLKLEILTCCQQGKRGT